MENIQVVLRARPLIASELRTNEKSCWEISRQTIQYRLKDFQNLKKPSYNQYSKLSFSYDHAFSPLNTNKEIYEKCVSSVVHSSLDGVNGTVFLYGQTGSGKTFTMLGPDGENAGEHIPTDNKAGILPLALKDLFARIEEVRNKAIYIYINNTKCFYSLYFFV
jgi:hypothetical protein